MSVPADRRGVLRLALAMLAAAVGGTASGSAMAQAAAHLRAQGRGARLTLPLPPGARWRLTASDRPRRLRLHLPGGWPGPARLAAAGPVAGGRWDPRSNSLVLDLRQPVAMPDVTRQGRSFVLLLQPGPAAGYARLVRAGALGQGGAAPAQPVARRGRAALPVVVLDPGHGGRDPGAIGVSGVQEKRIVLAAALELKRRLEAGGACRVVMTRTRDVFVPLADRVAFARKAEAALFVSVHADSAPGARGASVYTLSETASDALSANLARRENAADAAGGLRIPPVSPEVARILMSLVRQETRRGSDQMAKLVVASLRGDVPLLPNTHRKAAFAVLKAPDIPSVLVELGFLSDRQDEAALKRSDHRAKLATALAEAAQGFLGSRVT
ncbi:N-acetylmuramoyl-L-alanine amidase [Roseomonas sp. OT10]|uniref:N-acetylmuramoyl-L-alanine amidase family protein n=1 Tax=Roseomonas cutis TaxID=2897332 RepID=UPI001E3F8ECA|nr:N-acetylmuramoyl-L-alanine amidase [Roseomonas sp. OT10]UFN47829.1 N-acetylmuramoyl-L-alanine amidase [Roseomonas sp. OT10]